MLQINQMFFIFLALMWWFHRFHTPINMHRRLPSTIIRCCQRQIQPSTILMHRLHRLHNLITIQRRIIISRHCQFIITIPTRSNHRANIHPWTRNTNACQQLSQKMHCHQQNPTHSSNSIRQVSNSISPKSFPWPNSNITILELHHRSTTIMRPRPPPIQPNTTSNIHSMDNLTIILSLQLIRRHTRAAAPQNIINHCTTCPTIKLSCRIIWKTISQQHQRHHRRPSNYHPINLITNHRNIHSSRRLNRRRTSLPTHRHKPTTRSNIQCPCNPTSIAKDPPRTQKHRLRWPSKHQKLESLHPLFGRFTFKNYI